ncbi:MAG: phenylacetate--CoA ligase family protein [Candidatus Bathyarchaeia archaeon]
MVNYVRAYYYLRGLMKRVFWPKQKIRQYQNERLRETLEYAYENVPFYYRKFKEAEVKPSDVKTVEDLKRLPITRKDEIRTNPSEMVSKEYEVSKLKMLRTSGSTGHPLYFYISGWEDEYRKARHLRANIACGQRLRDRYVTITHPLYFSQSTRLQRFLGFYAPIPVSVFDDVDKQISTIERLKPDILDGYASSLLLLAKRIDEKGVETIKPRFLISGADLIDAYSRKYVEEVFGVPFYDQYGCAELERLAWQCEERGEYHIDADSIIMEFVDEDGDEVARGETGEIVCTSLFNRAMPIVRYAVGDLGRASEENECPCGRTFPLMKILEGRKDSVVVLPDGRAMSSFAFIAAMYQLSFYKDIDQFRVVQKREDLFRFLIKMKSNNVDSSSAEKELIGFFNKVLNVADNEVEFEVDFVDNIPLDESGKFRIVVSELDSARLKS